MVLRNQGQLEQTNSVPRSCTSQRTTLPLASIIMRKSILAKFKPKKHWISSTKPDKLDDIPARHAHNEQQPVSRLIHAGVFHSVLLILSDTYPPGRSRGVFLYRGNRTPFTLGWIYITHVCSSMRAVALDMSALWAQHVCAFSSQAIFEELCRRAKKRLITISNVQDYDVSDYSRRFYDFPGYYFTAPIRARCGTLRIEEAGYILEQIGTDEFPSLHTMVLHSIDPGYTNGAPEVNIRAAQIRHLTLFNLFVQVAWQNLVSIQINGGDGTRSYLTEDHILRMLENSVKLQSLRLRGFACRSGLTKTVHLPSLVELVLQSTLR